MLGSLLAKPAVHDFAKIVFDIYRASLIPFSNYFVESILKLTTLLIACAIRSIVLLFNHIYIRHVYAVFFLRRLPCSLTGDWGVSQGSYPQCIVISNLV
jgi:hypothetical protein